MTNEQSTSLSALRPAAPAPGAVVTMGFGNSASFELLQRGANMLAKSTLVPQSFQGNVGNCAIALNMALRMGADPIMVTQNLYIVYGRPAWSAKFLVATVNSCGRFSALRYQFRGDERSDDWACRAWALERETGERLDGPWISIGLAKAEGWYGKKDSKWKSMPEQMLRYRAAGWWTNVYAPEVAMGLRTEDEERDVFDTTRQADGSYSVTLSAEQTKGSQVAVEVNARTGAITVDPETGEILPDKDPAPRTRRTRQAAAPAPEGDGKDDLPWAEAKQEPQGSQQFLVISRYLPTASNVEAVNETLDLLRDLGPEDLTEAERAELVRLAAVRVRELTPGGEA